MADYRINLKGAKRRRKCHGWILYAKGDRGLNPHYVDLYCRACEKYGMSVELGICTCSWTQEESGQKQSSRTQEESGRKRSSRMQKDGRMQEDQNESAGQPLREAVSIERPAFVVNRTRDYLIAEILEELGVCVFNNSKVTELGNDKAKAYRYMEQKQIPIMATVYDSGRNPGSNMLEIYDSGRNPGSNMLEIYDSGRNPKSNIVKVYNEGRKTESNMLEVHDSGRNPKNHLTVYDVDLKSDLDMSAAYNKDIESIPYPAIIKSCSGHGGSEVYFIQDAKAHREWIEHSCQAGRAYVLQQAASDLGKDVRVYVVGNRITASVLRISDKDYRSNYCLGGQVRLYELSQEERDLVQRVISGLSIGMAGIDFIFHDGRMVFNEIEDVAGARGLYSLTDYDLVDDYVSYIREKI